jgi:tetratricopeptide (TPR) repeat protein
MSDRWIVPPLHKIMLVSICTAVLGGFPTVGMGQTPSPSVSAPHGVAVGRDLNTGGGDINIGWTPAQVKELIDRQDAAEQEIRRLSGQLGVTENAVHTFLRLLGEREIPVEDLTVKLVEIAQTHKALLTQVRTTPSDNPRVVALKEQAAQAIEQGHYDRAEILLTEVRETKLATARRQQEEANRDLLEAAQAQAEIGKLKLVQLQYAAAAAAFAQAAELVPENKAVVRAGYLSLAGSAAQEAGQYRDAVPWLTEALAIRETVHGPEHPNTATGLNNLALLYRDQGRLAEAEPLFQRAPLSYPAA